MTAAPPQIGVNVGSCPTSGDTVQATTPTGRVMPIVCGTLTGQHSECTPIFLSYHLVQYLKCEDVRTVVRILNTGQKTAQNFQHVIMTKLYIVFMETGASGGAGSLAITFGTATGATRTFKIKVTYYACDSLNK